MALILTSPSVTGDVTTYTASSTHNPQGTVFRIARPSTPAPGVPHRLLLVLPVKPGTNTDFGDGLDEIVTAGFHNTYNLTCLAPTFPTEPWIGDHPTTANRRYESFILLEVLPYAAATLQTSASDEYWVLSFSKGAYSAATLFFRNPGVFASVACWDIPARIPWTTGPSWEMDEAYGSEAQWDAAYRIETRLATWLTTPGQATTPARLYLSGDTSAYTEDTAWTRDALLAANVRFWFKGSDLRDHRWNSGWVPEALAALHAMAVARVRTYEGQPAQVPGIILPHPLAQGLALALFFHAQNGTTVFNSGTASGVAPATLLTTLSTIERTLVPTEYYQTAGAGLLFGSGFTALDQISKTLLIWARVTALGADQALISKDFDLGNGDDGGWGVMITAEGRLTWYADAAHRQGDTGSVSIVPETDMLFAVTWDASTGTARFYLDGVFTSAHVDGTAVENPSGAAQLNLGAIRNNTGMFFAGRFRQVRGYTRILTDGEIAALAADPYLGFNLFAAEPPSGEEALLYLTARFSYLDREAVHSVFWRG